MLTIQNFPKALQQRLRTRAERNGRSEAEEAREILREAVKDEMPTRQQKSGPGSAKEIYDGIRKIVEPHGGFELDLPPRDPVRALPEFE